MTGTLGLAWANTAQTHHENDCMNHHTPGRDEHIRKSPYILAKKAIKTRMNVNGTFNGKAKELLRGKGQ